VERLDWRRPRAVALVATDGRDKGLGWRLSCRALPRQRRSSAPPTGGAESRDNAVKFTAAVRYARAEVQDGAVTVSVSDTGLVWPQRAGTIFDEFPVGGEPPRRLRRVRDRLALCREIIEPACGQIGVRSSARSKAGHFLLHVASSAMNRGTADRQPVPSGVAAHDAVGSAFAWKRT